MKKTITLLLLLGAANTLFAQNATLCTKPSKHWKGLTIMQQNILTKQAIQTNINKTTAATKRIIGYSYVTQILEDSNHYYYSGGRGSGKNAMLDRFDPRLPGAVQEIMCDSSVNWRNNGGILKRSSKRAYAYNSNQQMIKRELHYTFASIENYSRDAFGRITEFTDTFLISGTPMPAGKTFVSYVQNNRVLDSTISLPMNTPKRRDIYTYDVANNMVQHQIQEMSGSAWKIYTNLYYTYDILNRLVMNYSELDMGTGILIKNMKDTFAYDGNATIYNYHAHYDWDTPNNTWRPAVADARNNTSAGRINSVNVLLWSGSSWDTADINIFNYDNDDLLLSTQGFEYLGNGMYNPVAYDKQTLYYEDYFPTSITVQTAVEQPFTLYPNPAHNELTIRVVKELEHGVINIINTMGQTIYTGKTGQHKTTINTQPLLPGTYIISVQSSNGTSVHRQQFNKL